MVLLKAQRLQQLAEKLGQLENRMARAGGELEGTERELKEAAALAGVELEAVRWLDGATLVRTLSPGGRPDPGRFWAVAEILYLDALRAEAVGEADTAARCFRKARRLYKRTRETGGLELPREETYPTARIEAIEERVQES